MSYTRNSHAANEAEEMIRVMNEKAYTKKGKSNLKAEKKRIHKELSSRGVTQHGRGHGKEIR
jgi:hypothetical protein|tara:strand:+ start:204 stop:389 length:186 start_codon:yes stop_codon:yes gene_type:complete